MTELATTPIAASLTGTNRLVAQPARAESNEILLVSYAVTKPAAALFVRPGNPKTIKGWNDLDNNNGDVITANPRTVGGARRTLSVLWDQIFAMRR